MTAPTAPATTARHHKLAALFASISMILSLVVAALGYTGMTSRAVQTTASATGSLGAVVSLLALAHIHIKVAEIRAWVGDAVTTVHDAPGVLEHIQAALAPVISHLEILQKVSVGHSFGIDRVHNLLADLTRIVTSQGAEKLVAAAEAATSMQAQAPSAPNPPAAAPGEPAPVPDVAGRDVALAPAPAQTVAAAQMPAQVPAQVPPGTGV